MTQLFFSGERERERCTQHDEREREREREDSTHVLISSVILYSPADPYITLFLLSLCIIA